MLISIAIILTSLFITSIDLLAQDSTETEKDWDWDWEWEFDEFEELLHFGRNMPTISVNYGFTNIKHNDVTGSFSNANIIGVQLGHTIRRTSRYADYLLKYGYKNLYINYISSDVASNPEDQNHLNFRTWQFGFVRSGGYGYKIGNVSIIPFFTYSFDWTRVEFINQAMNANDQSIISRFDKSFRFGTGNEGGIRIVAASLITIEAAYERAVVFERHLFWKWTGSALIEAAAHGLLDVFIREIFYSSPTAGPVVYFLLKNALSYGLYELRQEKMNWPFTSAAPLSLDGFKFGVMFTF
jgi:hypothetical protein